MKNSVCFILVIIIFLYPVYAIACTSFYLEHDTNPVHGANYDWPNGQGVIVVNKRGFLKTAISNPEKQLNPARWTSKYGSITFNLFGCDWAWGGMNEAGLSCSTMLLSETKYPEPDSRPSIFLGQWLQYQLDTCESIKDVLTNNAKIRIRQTDQKLKIHYFLLHHRMKSNQ